MKRQIELAGVKKIRVHDIRHSHVAYLIEKGVEPLLIRDRLGHKDIRITLNTYGHLYPNQQRMEYGINACQKVLLYGGIFSPV